MTSLLQFSIVNNKPSVTLEGEVECAQVYVIAGHKGQPQAIQKRSENDDIAV